MDEMFRSIFKVLGLKIRLRWPEISEEPVHRRLQAIDIAVRLGAFSADEMRAVVIDAWGDKWEDFPRKAPDIAGLPAAVGGAGQGILPVAGNSNTPETPGNTPDITDDGTGGTGTPAPLKAGNSGAMTGPEQPEPMSYGDHELRDE